MDISDTPEEAIDVMNQFEVDWFGVLRGDRVLGWANRDELVAGDLARLTPRDFDSTVSSSQSPTGRSPHSDDVVVTGRTRLAVVVDEGIFRGVLDIEAIAEDITE